MKKFTFKKFTKKSGSLIPFSLIKDVPFKTKRIFLIYGKKILLEVTMRITSVSNS